MRHRGDANQGAIRLISHCQRFCPSHSAGLGSHYGLLAWVNVAIVSIASRGAGFESAGALRILTLGGPSMVRIAALLIFGTLLAACSGSNRVEGIVPAWANTRQPSATHYVAQEKHVEGRSNPDAKPQQEPRTQEAAGPQEAEKAAARSLHEE
jgi:hypothetical protein